MTLFTTLLVLIFERLFISWASTGSLIIVLKRSFGG